MRKDWTSRTVLVLVAAILVVANLVGLNWFTRLDLTDDKVYSLSDASIETVRNLDDVVNITAFFTEDLPAPYAANRRFLQDKLDEYQAYGGSNIQYRFVDPLTDEELRAEAERFRVPTVQIQVVEDDNLQIKNAYMGLAIQYLDEREVIGVVEELSRLEYDITTAIRKMQRETLPIVGFLQGHGEPDPSQKMQTTLMSMRQYLDARTVTIENGVITPRPDVLLVIAPTDTFPADHLAAIDGFVQEGGKAGFLINTIMPEFQQGFGIPSSTNIGELLDVYGININDDLVIDRQSSTIQMQRQAGLFRVIEAVPYPFMPVSTSFSENPMVARLSDLRFTFVSSIDTSGVSGTVNVEPLVFSTPKSAVRSGFVMLQPGSVDDAELTGGPFAMAAAYSGQFPSFTDGGLLSNSTRMVAVGDGDFVDETLAGPIPSSIEFMLNMVDWLILDEDILEIRAKKIDPRPLDPIEDGLKAPIKYFALFFPPLLVVIAGLIRWRRKKS
jgi:gliding-associated putative ABC transporter substrate-binding component GldG